MEASLLHLMEELVESIEQRDAHDPDAPAWESALRIQRLEEELARRLASPPAVEPVRAGRPVASARPASTRRRHDDDLVAIG